MTKEIVSFIGSMNQRKVGERSWCWFKDEVTFGEYLKQKYGYEQLARVYGFNGHPRSLWKKEESPFACHFPKPIQNEAIFAPWPVIYLSGTLKTGWRGLFIDKLSQSGCIPAWLAQVDDELWEQYRTQFEHVVSCLVYGADAMIFHPPEAGAYSFQELDAAKQHGLTVYYTTDTHPTDLVKLIALNHYPNQFVPKTNPPLATAQYIDMLQLVLSDATPKILQTLDVRAALDRRRGNVPWRS